MNVIYSVKLNVSEKNVLKPLIVKQKDSNSRYIDCAFFHGRFMLLVRSGSVVVNVTRADGQIKSFAGTINDNGTVRIPVANWMTENAGTISCDVSVYDGDEKLTSATFEIEVDPSQNPFGTVSPDDPNVDLAEQLVERCEAAVQEIETKFGDAGINGVEYNVLFDNQIETAMGSNYPKPIARIDGVSRNSINSGTYRITLDGVSYTLDCIGWWVDYDRTHQKGTPFIGNGSYLGDYLPGGFLKPYPNVPFLIITTLPVEEDSSHVYLLTSESGSHSLKIEKLEYDIDVINQYLIFGEDKYHPIYMFSPESGYRSYEIGSNSYTRSPNPNGNIGIGFFNVLGAPRSIAFGSSNHINGEYAVSCGNFNDSAGYWSASFGHMNSSSGSYATSVGINNTASGVASMSDGYQAVASGKFSGSHGHGTIANHADQHAHGAYNVPDDSSAAATVRGNYVEIVGNGSGDNDRSNARTLDWGGNESLSGSITLGMGTEDEVTLTAAQLKRLIALLS